MKIKLILLTTLLLTFSNKMLAQTKILSVAEQSEDFKIFTGSLKEGHSGIYYFIDKVTFEKKCDSVQKTFKENSSTENYYLKLRFLITLLNHGHTRINLPVNKAVNYKMEVLDSTKRYLPFQFIIINKQLLIKDDCSKEQLFPAYSVVKSIGGVSSKTLINKMLNYIPADGINKTFKYYNLYNYFYFHFLYNLFYPEKKDFEIELANNNTHYYIKGLLPREIETNYKSKTHKDISSYGKQLEYISNINNATAYLKINSFYKGLIENNGQKYEEFLDNSFADIKTKNIKDLIIDIRDNEGGGDSYDNILTSYLIGQIPNLNEDIIKAPGINFKFVSYSHDLSDDVKGFIENPSEFLKDDVSLQIKQKYVDMMTSILTPIKNQFLGDIYVLTNGGSFSASTNFIKQLYRFRANSKRKIFFVGEENGGDIYSNTECAGQGYKIILPISLIEVDMPFLCFGELQKKYPKKRLPDFTVYDNPKDLINNKDSILEYTLNLIRKK